MLLGGEPCPTRRDRIPRKSIQSTRISTSRETTTTQACSRDDDRSSYHVNSELTSPLVWPSWNTYHRGTDIRISFECVVTQRNVRQRLEERDVPCIVVDVRSRTCADEKRSEEKEAVRTAIMYVAMNHTVWESLERLGGLSVVEYTWI